MPHTEKPGGDSRAGLISWLASAWSRGPHLPKYSGVVGLTFPGTHTLLNSLNQPAMGFYWYQYGGGCLGWPSPYGEETVPVPLSPA